MLNLAEVKEYLAIDYEDTATDRNLTRLIGVADKFLKGSLGEKYPADDFRAKEIALIIIGDLFDDHSLNEKVAGNTRKLVNDMSQQLRLELRRAGGGIQ